MMRAQTREQFRQSVTWERQGTAQRGRDADDEPENRRIVHVDMDAFFASIEERDNPELKGKPVIVGGPKGSRGVVTTANYVARQFGVHAGMSLARAEKLCPAAHHVGTKGGKYMSVSLDLMAVLRRFSPVVDPVSIDEAYLDGTGCRRIFGDSDEEYGQRIKSAIKQELNLTASVGMGVNKLVAKIASGMEKPDGLTIIRHGEIMARLGPLPVGKVPGIGPSAQSALSTIGVNTIRDLVKYPDELLKRALGGHGSGLIDQLKGRKGEQVTGLEHHVEDKSKGHERTFHVDVECEKTVLAQLLYLCDRTSRRLRRDGYVGRVVTVKVRTSDFHTREHQRALKSWSDDPQEIFQMARWLFRELWQAGGKPIRLIGVSVSGLVQPGWDGGVQEDLFTWQQRSRRKELLRAVDSLKNLYGESAIELAGSLQRSI